MTRNPYGPARLDVPPAHRFTETSTVSLVLEALRAADDFLTRAMIRAATKRPDNAIAGALHHLRKCRCVDVVVEPDGVGWWYALPEESDTRSRTHDEHAPHPTGIRCTRRKAPRGD